MNKKVCITDLDGTLLGSNRKISPLNRQSLDELGELGIVRVLATGRSLWSLKRVLNEEDPFDYVIFATGAGIMNWKTGEMIHSCNLNTDEISFVNEILDQTGMDYMIHFPVPDTHFMLYREKAGLTDFWERIRYYKAFSEELNPDNLSALSASTQALLIAPVHRDDIHPFLVKSLAPLNVIRTTSPIDYQSHWIEVFSSEVSKGRAVKYLLNKLQISITEAMIMGNDYNDEDMLELCSNSYVTDNAAEDLKQRFYAVAHHDSDGFSEAVNHWLYEV